MTWKPPATEAEWEECLSTYTDGELDAGAAGALEAYLQGDPKRARQLEAIRKTSDVLQSWTVDAPTMDTSLRAAIAERSGRVASLTPRWRGAVRMAAAFALGVTAGMLGMNALQPSGTQTRVQYVTQATPPHAAEPAIADSQAESVFLEVEAAALSRQIEQDAKASRWKNAQAGIERMQNEYAETNAAQAFANGPTARRVLRYALRRSS
jgi:anti-sigma factor RsiW